MVGDKDYEIAYVYYTINLPHNCLETNLISSVKMQLIFGFNQPNDEKNQHQNCDKRCD